MLQNDRDKMFKSDEEPEPEREPEISIEENATALLASLIRRIANGDVTVTHVGVENDLHYAPRWSPATWESRGKTLEINYSDSK